MELDNAAVGRRVTIIRMSAELDKQSFAEVLRVDPSSLTKIEKGTKPLLALVALRMAERFGVTLDYIYRGDVSGLSPPTRLPLFNAEKSLRRAEAEAASGKKK